MLRIETSFGLVLTFDGSNWVSVNIPPLFRNCVEGTYITYFGLHNCSENTCFHTAHRNLNDTLRSSLYLNQHVC